MTGYRSFVVVCALLLVYSCDLGNLLQPDKKPDEKPTDTSGVQWDAEAGRFKVEAGAHLFLGFDNDGYANGLIALWNSTHPEAQGAVEQLNTPSDTAAKKMADLGIDGPDVAMVLTSDASRYETALAPMPSQLTTLARANVNRAFYDQANQAFDNPKVLPFAYDGMAFVWNKTMLAALGEDVTVDSENLPVALNTWEEIFALGTKWSANRPTYMGKKVNIVFPVSLDEPWSGYSSLTTSGWQIFAEQNPLSPGFQKPAFKSGLEFLVAAKDAKVSVEADGSVTPGSGMGWRWDPVLNDQTAPFGLVGTWMDVQGALSKGGHDLQFAPMPTWKGIRATPFLKVKVLAINSASKYPSAAAELVRLAFTTAGMQAMVNNSGYVPALQENAAIAPNLSSDLPKKQMLMAFLSSVPEPITLHLPKNPNKQAMDLYYNIGINQVFKDVWDGKVTPSVAQTTIVAASDQWIQDNNVAP